jgi:TolB-like protein
MAPEQLRGEAADARSDIWALGVLLYEMAAGVRPFKGRTGFEVSSAILKEKAAPLPRTVPSELGGIVGRCLEKEPGRRFRRASEVEAALKVVEGTGARSGAGRSLWLARRRLLPIGGALFALLVVLAALNSRVLRQRLSQGLGASSGATKLAVLPFKNLSGDPEQEYFSDGLTEEMIAQLGRLHPQRLRVIARTSAMHYKRTDKPIDQIGRELGVDYILEGSALREAGRVRITAELIQARDQTQLWAESYERQMSGILALQSDVARAVAASLALKLLPAEQDRLASARPVNPEAYDANLIGLAALDQADAGRPRRGTAVLRARAGEGSELCAGLCRHRVGLGRPQPDGVGAAPGGSPENEIGGFEGRRIG